VKTNPPAIPTLRNTHNKYDLNKNLETKTDDLTNLSTLKTENKVKIFENPIKKIVCLSSFLTV